MRLEGPWITTYDEKELTNQYLCMGVNFKQLKDGSTDAPQLAFEQANAIYEETRKALREQGENKIADQKYFVNAARKWVYDIEGDDRSVASIDYSDEALYRTLRQGDTPEKFNEYKFEKQFVKYSQILDTDYDSFALVYSCQENALWENAKTEQELEFDEVFRAYVNQAEAAGIDLTASGKSLYAAENFENLPGIKKTLIHKQKVHVFTRPAQVDGEYKYQPFDNMRLSLMLNDVATKYLPKDFDQGVLDTFYSKMVHDNTCDYNPYAVEAYYQTIRREAEEEESQQAKKTDEETEMEHEEL